jgi:hypothetical protein
LRWRDWLEAAFLGMAVGKRAASVARRGLLAR